MEAKPGRHNCLAGTASLTEKKKRRQNQTPSNILVNTQTSYTNYVAVNAITSSRWTQAEFLLSEFLRIA